MIPNIPYPYSLQVEHVGASTDIKPNKANKYAVYLELDTQKTYYWDGEEWKLFTEETAEAGITDDELRATPLEVTDPIVAEDTIDGIRRDEWLSLAMDKTNNMPLFTEVSNPGRRDINQAAIPSDCPNPILFTSLTVANQPLIIDTQGYNSIVIHSLTSGIITPTTSHDNRNWLGMVGYTATAPKTLITTCAAAGVHVFPCTGRFVKLTGPASLVQAIVYLRNIQTVPLSTIGTVDAVGRVNQWNGTDIVTAGLAGVLSVGGNVATGAAPTTNPIQIGGVDIGRLTGVAANLTPKVRRILVDERGRLISSEVEPNSGLNFHGALSAYVQEVSQLDGVSMVELLGMILGELRILTQQIHELGRGSTFSSKDSPEELRKDFYNFNQ